MLSRQFEESVCIEVEGDLDVVAAHDLRQVLRTALRTATGTIIFDFSSVTSADADGISALTWCSDRAVEARRRLMWSRCSQPMRRDVHAATAGPMQARNP